MANVGISSVIDIDTFSSLPPINGPEKTAFFESGIVVRDANLDAAASQSTTDNPTLVNWTDIDGTTEANYGNDNPASAATPEAVAQSSMTARIAYLNKGYSAADLANELTLGDNALIHVRRRIDTMWMRQWQRRLNAIIQGIVADNIANDSSDMVNDIAIEDGNNALAANLWSDSAFQDAAFTLGDRFADTSVIAMHSVVYKRLVAQNTAEDVYDSDGRKIYTAYQGRRIVVDDNMPTVDGSTSGTKYYTAIYGPGSFGWGAGTPTYPEEIERKADQGNGAGVEILWTRRTWLLHPLGFDNVGAQERGVSQTWANLADAATWDRVYDRKNIPMAFLITNG